MTNDEAVEVLRGWNPWDDIEDNDRFREAIYIAIKAIWSQECKPWADDWEPYADKLWRFAYKCGQEDKKCGQEDKVIGYWIETEDTMGDTCYQCSHCGMEWYTLDGKPEDNDMNYCAACGCKMIEVEQ